MVRTVVRSTSGTLGPVHNFGNQIKLLVETGETSEIEFRNGDFCADLSENMNELVSQIENSKRINELHENLEYLVAGGVHSR